ncbi:MAG: phosphatase PAP2 family protein [Flavobacteriaceae bacterium]|jgi:undecaprenyl-diphosphatase|nr:phosphatase PAP2 family protein [Flavobacteriaceae bacterium]
MEILVHWDTQLFLFLNNLGCPQFDTFWLFVTDRLSWFPLYGILAIIIFEKFGWKKALLILVCVALMIAVSDGLASLVKGWVKRPRPCLTSSLDGLFRLVIDSCRGRYCYFSAHAANSFALAMYLSALFQKEHKYAPFLLFVWAAVVSYSRIYVGVHFPLDVLTGALVGLAIGWIFGKTLKIVV